MSEDLSRTLNGCRESFVKWCKDEFANAPEDKDFAFEILALPLMEKAWKAAWNYERREISGNEIAIKYIKEAAEYVSERSNISDKARLAYNGLHKALEVLSTERESSCVWQSIESLPEKLKDDIFVAYFISRGDCAWVKLKRTAEQAQNMMEKPTHWMYVPQINSIEVRGSDDKV